MTGRGTAGSQTTSKTSPAPGGQPTRARSITCWYSQIVAWHRSRVSNGPTEGLDNLIKRIKQIGFRNFGNYRIQALLYAGKPNGDYSPRCPP